MPEPGPLEAIYFRNEPLGAAPPAHGGSTHVLAPANRPYGDYAWTHSAPVEGFFLVLTIAVVPIAILRWSRRLRRLARETRDRRLRLRREEV